MINQVTPSLSTQNPKVRVPSLPPSGSVGVPTVPHACPKRHAQGGPRRCYTHMQCNNGKREKEQRPRTKTRHKHTNRRNKQKNKRANEPNQPTLRTSESSGARIDPSKRTCRADKACANPYQKRVGLYEIRVRDLRLRVWVYRVGKRACGTRGPDNRTRGTNLRRKGYGFTE